MDKVNDAYVLNQQNTHLTLKKNVSRIIKSFEK